MKKGPKPIAPEIRFWRHVVIDEISGCWIWIGAKTPGGYGKIKVDKVLRYTHDFSIELFDSKRWPCPSGLEWCHRCPSGANSSCANPNHIFADTHKANVLEGKVPEIGRESIKIARIAAAAEKRARTHCIHGHPFSGENLRVNVTTGKRSCRACRRKREPMYRARRLLHKMR